MCDGAPRTNRIVVDRPDLTVKRLGRFVQDRVTVLSGGQQVPLFAFDNGQLIITSSDVLLPKTTSEERVIRLANQPIGAPPVALDRRGSTLP
jgi:hypothetical protein